MADDCSLPVYGSVEDKVASTPTRSSRKLIAWSGKPGVLIGGVCVACCGLLLCSLYWAGTYQEMASLLGLNSLPQDSTYYPKWAQNGALRYYDNSDALGQWSPETGPPYIKHVTMWSDPNCVDHTGPADNVRRILGLRTSWHNHEWNTNSYMASMSSFPEMTTRAMAMLNDFVLVGGNTILVVGGPTGALFINQNLAGSDGYGYELEPKWVDGPYEMQSAATGSAFQYGAVTLPSIDTSVVGVTTSSLPKEAISYYEASEVSVVFALPCEAGRILYIGYNYDQMVPAWTDILLLALRSSPTR